MTQEEKLRRIIEKAIERGYLCGPEIREWVDTHPDPCDYKWKGDCFIVSMPYSTTEEHVVSLEGVIFSHSFLKTFFGEEPKYIAEFVCHADEPSHTDTIDYWQYHAQQLVLSENRIDYLYQFVK